MSLSDPALDIRLGLLILGGIMAIASGFVCALRAMALPKSEFRTFFAEFMIATGSLGVVMLGFGIGDIFKYGPYPTFGTLLTTVASVVGVVGIFVFVHAMWKFTKYIRGMGP
jgi:hypothetical protein